MWMAWFMNVPVHRSQKSTFYMRCDCLQVNLAPILTLPVENADERAGVPANAPALIQEGVPDARDRGNVQRAPQRFGEVCAYAAQGIGVPDLVSA
jgi:hypothetical protein